MDLASDDPIGSTNNCLLFHKDIYRQIKLEGNHQNLQYSNRLKDKYEEDGVQIPLVMEEVTIPNFSSTREIF